MKNRLYNYVLDGNLYFHIQTLPTFPHSPPRKEILTPQLEAPAK